LLLNLVRSFLCTDFVEQVVSDIFSKLFFRVKIFLWASITHVFVISASSLSVIRSLPHTLSRREQTAFSGLLIGHTRLTKTHLLHVNAKCILTIEHVLCICTKCDNNRKHYFC